MSRADQDRWIVIPRWDEFQHRDMARTSVPPWIKNLTRLLGDTDYLALSQAQRGILHGLWLMYAAQRRVVSESDARRVLARTDSEARYWRGHLEALNHAGFIEVSASRPARDKRDPASLEVEVDKERFLKTPKSASKTLTKLTAMIANGALTNTIDLEAEITAAPDLTATEIDTLRESLQPRPLAVDLPEQARQAANAGVPWPQFELVLRPQAEALAQGTDLEDILDAAGTAFALAREAMTRAPGRSAGEPEEVAA